MQRSEILEILRVYLVDEVLDGSAGTLTAATPLLEWGILTSISTMRLVSFIGERFAVRVPLDDVVGGNFKDLDAIARLVDTLATPSDR